MPSKDKPSEGPEQIVVLSQILASTVVWRNFTSHNLTLFNFLRKATICSQIYRQWATVLEGGV